jgi:hypothetical protein
MRPEARIVTVTTPAPSYALVDLGSLKLRLGLTGTTADAALNLFVADASAAAIRYMNNPIAVETLTEQIWPWRDRWLGAVPNRAGRLQLSRWPIVSVTSVTETIAGTATALVAGTDFLVEPNAGQLVRLDSFGRPRAWNADPVAIVYSAGYAAVPSDLQEAVSEMVKARYYAQTRDPLLRSENVEGVYQAAYWSGGGPGAETDMPPAIQAKLDRYRVPVVR